MEFLCHRDTTTVQAPCVLNYWRSSHYGGAVVDVVQGESWTKVVGPFMLYVNEAAADAAGGASGEEAQKNIAMSLWKDARAQAVVQAGKWPYGWVNGVDYPHKDERSTVSGQFDLHDALMPGGARFMGRLMVGMTAAGSHADAAVSGARIAPDYLANGRQAL